MIIQGHLLHPRNGHLIFFCFQEIKNKGQVVMGITITYFPLPRYMIRWVGEDGMGLDNYRPCDSVC